MIRNYLKAAWRSSFKNKKSSVINVGGLAIGMAVAMLIGLWVYDEFTFDRNFDNYEQIAQVKQNANFNGKIETWNSNPVPMASEIRAKYGSDFKYVAQASWIGSHLLTVGDKKITQKGMYFEPDGPNLLSINVLKGSSSGLKDPYSIMLSSSTSQAIFGNEDPVNKTIRLNNLYEVKVTAVYEDLPDNNSFSDLKVIMPWELWLIDNPWAKNLTNPWESNNSQTFVQIADQADMGKVSAKIKNLQLDNVSEESRKNQWAVFLHPMKQWNLYNEFKNGVITGGNIRYVKLFGLIGVFVLLLACINFMNLATARSEKRAKEVGIRKTIGSSRKQLIVQFFTESYLVVFFSFLLSLLLVGLSLPLFNDVAGKKIEIPLYDPIFWFFSLSFVMLTGLLAGVYPALYLSSFDPLKVLKGTFKAGRLAATPRKVMVVLQFSVSVILIIGTIVVHQQIQHARNRSVGYSKDRLINLSSEREIMKHFDAFETELKATGVVKEMTASYSPMTSVWNSEGGFDWEGKPPGLAVQFPTNAVSYDFGKTVKWEVKSGRDFSRSFVTDSAAFLINESAAKYIGFKDPIGKTIRWGRNTYTITGVVGDILQESPFYPVRPSIYYLGSYENMGNIIVKLSSDAQTSKALAEVEKVWKKYSPESSFDYQFIDEEFGSKFRAEERVGKLSSYFAVLAIFISCLGLYGMASFVAEQRTKEIGIRKVLGASITGIWKMLSKEFLILVTISCAAAIPVAGYYLEKWLQNYDYRITIHWMVYLTAAALVIGITLLTVSMQALKAARANPVRSLRTE